MRSISESKRKTAIEMLEKGHSVRETAEKIRVSKTTVGSIRLNYCSNIQKSKGGRPTILSERDKPFCVRKVTRDRIDDAVKVTKALENELGLQCSPATVRRALKEKDLSSIEKPKKTLLSAKNIKARLEWCREHKDWTLDDWKRVIWSDETKINRFNSDGRQWAWIRFGEELQNHHCKLTVKHGGGNIMVWSAISYAGVGWMCQIKGNMDKQLYKQILEDELEKTIEDARSTLRFRRDQMIFQQDDDPKHTSKLVKEYLSQQSYKVMEWPAQSPDLNPIENMWSLLKRKLNEYGSAPKGLESLNERVIDIWYNKITPEDCQKVIESMPNRIQACLKAKGKWTKY